ncbi:MAG: polysaccharide deacetylase family protein [Akkermansiaceae bacterium]|nr:polysaccharide deacetylase family protein [Akkermansiaceae bacterium]
MKPTSTALVILVSTALSALAHGPIDHGEATLIAQASVTPANNTGQPSTTAPSAPTAPNTAPATAPGATTNDDGVRVTVLGYHDFSKIKTPTEMLISTGKFRKQMQAIKELGLHVISMEDFIAWKRGEKKIQDKSVLITIDDGWKSVYTDAYPILKEHKFPFTVFLYTNYIDGGASALTSAMIKEMQNNGCTVASHSISHPYPATVKAERAKGSDEFATYLRKEMGGSRKELEKKFGGKVNAYAYPGGYVTGEMLPIATECGYECLFTVLPGKTTLATSNFTIPRYVILGTHDYIFRNATSFSATSTTAATDGAIVQSTPHPVKPEPGALITTRLPTVSADLSKVANIDVESIVMRVAGFGKVPATYDAASKTASWTLNRRLRSRTCEVSVQWRTLGATKYEQPMTWIFRIDREAAYQPSSPIAP